MKKSVKILVVVLCFIILVLITFIVIDKVMNNKDSDKTENAVNIIEEDNNNSISNEVANSTNEIKKSNKDEASNNIEEILTNEEAYKLGEEMYNKITTFNIKTEENNEHENNERVTNISELKAIATGEAFDEAVSTNCLKKSDDGNYYRIAGRGSNPEYLDKHSLKVSGIKNNEIKYVVTEYYLKNIIEDEGKSFDELNENQIETREYDFILVKENQQWKVSEYTMPQ